jgi:dihydrofolate reductase
MMDKTEGAEALSSALRMAMPGGEAALNRDTYKVSPQAMTIVVAVSSNGVIGREQTLPWRLSSDLRRFKKLTMGHALLMGRKTYESIGRPLPGRTTIVVTRQKGYSIPGVMTAHSIPEALSMLPAGQHLFVVGGGEIYRLAMPWCSKIVLTRVQTSVEGDVYFDVPEADWECAASESFPAGENDEFETSFQVWLRRSLLPTPS